MDNFSCEKNPTSLFMLGKSKAASISSKIKNGAGLTLK